MSNQNRSNTAKQKSTQDNQKMILQVVTIAIIVLVIVGVAWAIISSQKPAKTSSQSPAQAGSKQYSASSSECRSRFEQQTGLVASM